jgi:TolA-binding protein
VRSSPRGWRDKAYRWFTRKPLAKAYLVFTDDPRFEVAERDEWLAPPEVPLPGGVEARATVADESIEVTTNRVGHPLLVKVSYHPRWRAEGADGPYLVSPALMLIVPRQPTVRLTYARNAADGVGLALSAGALLAGLGALVRAWAGRGRPRPAAAMAPIPLDECTVPPPTRRWGSAVPAALILACVAARLATLRPPAPDPRPMYESASRAYAAGRFAEAAEYARHALARAPSPSLRAELRCLRGESLLRAGDATAAAEAFQAVLEEADHAAYGAQALFGLAQARAAAGDADGARQARERLLREYADSPWAQRAREAAGTPAATSG